MNNQALHYQLTCIVDMLGNLNDTQYRHRSIMLGGVSIGQHTRHVIDSVQCMLAGYDSGRINYDGRKRDPRIENDRIFAIAQLKEVMMDSANADKLLDFADGGSPQSTIGTTYFRELIYNADHAVHHMALMRVALRELQLDIVDDNFGKAPATIAFEQVTLIHVPN